MAAEKSGKVLFDFSFQADNQISLKKGTVVQVISVGQKGGWSKAREIGTGM
jgi:hypothetical protein